MTDKIINFPKVNTRDEAEKGLGIVRKTEHCKCIAVTAHEKTRTLVCRNCGAAVDAFDWVYRVSSSWQVLEDKKDRVKLALSMSEKELEGVKRELRNTKAALSRAKKTQAKQAEEQKPEISRDPDTKDWVDTLRNEL